MIKQIWVHIDWELLLTKKGTNGCTEEHVFFSETSCQVKEARHTKNAENWML